MGLVVGVMWSNNEHTKKIWEHQLAELQQDYQILEEYHRMERSSASATQPH